MKSGWSGVDPALIDSHGAVSEEVAIALADGARTVLGADIGIGVTGIAGPDGGTEDKPVGTVCFAVTASDGASLVARDAAAGRARRRARPLDDRRDASRRARPAGRRRRRAGDGAVNARLFAAADLPVEVREALVTWAHQAVGDDRALRLVGPQALHVTLCFLGWREAGDAQRVGEIVTSCAAAARGLAVGRVLWLAPRRPHVLTVGLDDPRGELPALQAAVSRRAGRRRRLHPRGTRVPAPRDGRARAARGSRPLRRGLPPLPELEPFHCPSLTLYRSQLGPGGARYEALARVDLPGE